MSAVTFSTQFTAPNLSIRLEAVVVNGDAAQFDTAVNFVKQFFIAPVQEMAFDKAKAVVELCRAEYGVHATLQARF